MQIDASCRQDLELSIANGGAFSTTPKTAVKSLNNTTLVIEGEAVKAFRLRMREVRLFPQMLSYAGKNVFAAAPNLGSLRLTLRVSTLTSSKNMIALVCALRECVFACTASNRSCADGVSILG